ncbi:trypsin-like serine protease [Thioclava sp. GXIMD2076]|uniref:trypsin-like serine peptidase n=1 Tax=Thioclava sp. GXIMD2076 TaxID=3131931 RepID=UPI0030CCB45E
MTRLAVRVPLLLALALPAGVAAQTTLRALTTGDAGRGWEAVGRLDFDDGGFCTASLVGADLILTAAHCLYDSETRQKVDMSSAQFRMGLRNDRAIVVRRIKEAYPHPDYAYQGPHQFDRAAEDMALLRLMQPVRISPIEPFQLGDRPAIGAALQVVSYAEGRENLPSLQQSCTLLQVIGERMVTDCDVDFGASGAPVFVMKNGRPRIVGIVSAKGKLGDRKVALLADAGEMHRMLTDLRQSGGQRAQMVGGAKFISVAPRVKP